MCEARMSKKSETLVIKRYASRRLYNPESSDYVTLKDIAKLIRGGRDVSIVDLKTGEDLTRQYLIQIIAEQESQGVGVLPVNLLTEAVRSYNDQAYNVFPKFLESSLEAFRESQTKLMENFATMSPIAAFDAMQNQQQAFIAQMLRTGNAKPQPPETRAERSSEPDASTNLDEIKRTLSDLQAKIASFENDNESSGE